MPSARREGPADDPRDPAQPRRHVPPVPGAHGQSVIWYGNLDRVITLLKIGAARYVTAPALPTVLGQLTVDDDGWPTLPANASDRGEGWRSRVELTSHYMRDTTCDTCNRAAELCGHRADETRDRP